nr:uncharacterized protein LOC109191598 [Ipomoea batatas]
MRKETREQSVHCIPDNLAPLRNQTRPRRGAGGGGAANPRLPETSNSAVLGDELEEFEGSDYEIDQWLVDDQDFDKYTQKDVEYAGDGVVEKGEQSTEKHRPFDEEVNLSDDGPIANNDIGIEVNNLGDSVRPTLLPPELPSPLWLGQPETEMQGQGQPEIEVQREMTEVEVYAEADNANVDAEEMRLEWNSQLAVEWEIPVDPLNDVGDSIEPLFDDAGFDGMTNDTNQDQRQHDGKKKRKLSTKVNKGKLPQSVPESNPSNAKGKKTLGLPRLRNYMLRSKSVVKSKFGGKKSAPINID